MTLGEMSAQYQRSAQKLRERLAHLRSLLKNTDDPEEVWHLKRRIAELAPLLTEMNELAELTAKYYERGHYRSEKYSFNGLRNRFAKTAENRFANEDSSGGIDGIPTGYAHRVLSEGAVADGLRKRKRRKQVHGVQDPCPGGEESPALREVLMNSGDAAIRYLLGDDETTEK